MTGRLFLEAALDSGQTLTWEEETDVYYWVNGLHAAYLTSTEKQTVILELWPFGANWTPALYILLEVEDGALVERGRMTISHDGSDPGSLIPDTPLMGLEVSEPDSSGLQALRVPTHVDKWSDPDWHTLRWNGQDWQYT